MEVNPRPLDQDRRHVQVDQRVPNGDDRITMLDWGTPSLLSPTKDAQLKKSGLQVVSINVSGLGDISESS